MNWITKLFARILLKKPKLLTEPGVWYRLQNRKGEWYGNCSTNGSSMWLPEKNHILVEILNAWDADNLYHVYTTLNEGPVLEVVPHSDLNHPRHHAIPAPTSHYTLQRTDDGKWYAKAVVDGKQYETLPYLDKDPVIKDAKKGQMFDTVNNQKLGHSKRRELYTRLEKRMEEE